MLIHFDSFENYFDLNSDSSVIQSSNSCRIMIGFGRHKTNALVGSCGLDKIPYIRSIDVNTNTLIFGFNIKFILVNTNLKIIFKRDDEYINHVVLNSNSITLYKNTTFLSSFSFVNTLLEYSFIEFKIKFDNNGLFEVRDSGKDITDNNGNHITTNILTSNDIIPNNFEIETLKQDLGDLFYLSDLYILDDFGTDYYDFLNPIKVLNIKPISVGSENNAEFFSTESNFIAYDLDNSINIGDVVDGDFVFDIDTRDPDYVLAIAPKNLRSTIYDSGNGTRFSDSLLRNIAVLSTNSSYCGLKSTEIFFSFLSSSSPITNNFNSSLNKKYYIPNIREAILLFKNRLKIIEFDGETHSSMSETITTSQIAWTSGINNISPSRNICYVNLLSGSISHNSLTNSHILIPIRKIFRYKTLPLPVVEDNINSVANMQIKNKNIFTDTYSITNSSQYCYTDINKNKIYNNELRHLAASNDFLSNSILLNFNINLPKNSTIISAVLSFHLRSNTYNFDYKNIHIINEVTLENVLDNSIKTVNSLSHHQFGITSNTNFIDTNCVIPIHTILQEFVSKKETKDLISNLIIHFQCTQAKEYESLATKNIGDIKLPKLEISYVINDPIDVGSFLVLTEGSGGQSFKYNTGDVIDAIAVKSKIIHKTTKQGLPVNHFIKNSSGTESFSSEESLNSSRVIYKTSSYIFNKDLVDNLNNDCEFGISV